MELNWLSRLTWRYCFQILFTLFTFYSFRVETSETDASKHKWNPNHRRRRAGARGRWEQIRFTDLQSGWKKQSDTPPHWFPSFCIDNTALDAATIRRNVHVVAQLLVALKLRTKQLHTCVICMFVIWVKDLRQNLYGSIQSLSMSLRSLEQGDRLDLNQSIYVSIYLSTYLSIMRT